MQHPLASPYRVSANPRPDGPDQADVYETLLRTRAARTRRIVGSLFGLVAVLFGFASIEQSKRSDEKAQTERGEVEARAAERIADARLRIETASRVAQEEQARFSEVVGAALDANHAPSAAQLPCNNIRLPEPNRLVRAKQLPLLRLASRSDRDLPSPSVGRLIADIHRAEERFQAGRDMEAILYSNALFEPTSKLRYDIILATTSFEHPRRDTPTSFDPGKVEGRVFVYDFTEHRITCSGDISVKSSKNIPYSWATSINAPPSHDQGPSLTASLDDDLDLQVERSIASGVLYRVDDRVD